MDCKTKEMSSYQRLKWELENLITERKEIHWNLEMCKEALWKIANMKGPQVTEAPSIALQALFKTNEKK